MVWLKVHFERFIEIRLGLQIGIIPEPKKSDGSLIGMHFLPENHVLKLIPWINQPPEYD